MQLGLLAQVQLELLQLVLIAMMRVLLLSHCACLLLPLCAVSLVAAEATCCLLATWTGHACKQLKVNLKKHTLCFALFAVLCAALPWYDKYLGTVTTYNSAYDSYALQRATACSRVVC